MPDCRGMGCATAPITLPKKHLKNYPLGPVNTFFTPHSCLSRPRADYDKWSMIAMLHPNFATHRASANITEPWAMRCEDSPDLAPSRGSPALARGSGTCTAAGLLEQQGKTFLEWLAVTKTRHPKSPLAGNRTVIFGEASARTYRF
jgi:hypothetical protein